MRLSPIEIRQHRFQTRLRGFDPAEVEAFLEAVVADFEEIVRENAKLRQEVERLSLDAEAYRSREKAIQETLTTAQRVADQLKRTAARESEVIVSEAQLRAEKLVHEVEERRSGVAQEITELGHLRERAEADLRRTLEGYLRLIKAYREARATTPTTAPAAPATAPASTRTSPGTRPPGPHSRVG
jgi:cell division initiation protein